MRSLEKPPQFYTFVTDAQPFDALRTDDLLLQARGGNHDAWREIYRRYRPFLMLVIGGDAGLRPGEPDDVLQSTFLAAWQDIEGFTDRGTGSLRAWLRKIVIHKLRKVKLHLPSSPPGPQKTDWLNLVPDASGGEPLDRAIEEESQRRLFDCMDEYLEPIQREILMLRYFESLTRSQVAEIVELSESMVSKHYSAAMERMTRELNRGDEVQ